MRILTIGIREIKPELFHPITQTFHNKPDPKEGGCLWGSTQINLPNGCTSDWKRWTNANDLLDFSYGISYTLHKKAKILEIGSVYDYVKAMNIYKHLPYENSLTYSLNFSRISKDFDAFHLTRNVFLELRLKLIKCEDILFEDFYSYDAESWIIFNPDCINYGSVINRNDVRGLYDNERTV